MPARLNATRATGLTNIKFTVFSEVVCKYTPGESILERRPTYVGYLLTYLLGWSFDVSDGAHVPLEATLL